MPSRITPHTLIEKQRVLEAHRAGREDWLAVARFNGIPVTTAYDIVRRGRVDYLPRGGTKHVNMTPEAKVLLEKYLNENCTYTLDTMRTMLFLDCGVKVDTSTISRHLKGMLFTVKQVRVEPTTCNSESNIEKRRVFAVKLKEHQDAGNCIVYYDETNYNIYLKRLRGRSRRGERAMLSLPPSKGANLQIQCAVSSSIGLVAYQLEHGSIRMEKNAAFVEEIYKAVKASQEFRNFFQGKKIVIVLDNAPAHRQTEDRVTEHGDMELLRLGPCSPMCNPIEGCFSVLKANIKRHLAIYREEICDRSPQLDENGDAITLAGRQMRVLEMAAKAEMKGMTSVLVSGMELHCSKAVNAAAEGIPMVYGK